MAKNYAFKAHVPFPTFGPECSGHDNCDWSDREPTEEEDGDHHRTIFEIDPLLLTDVQAAALCEGLTLLNQQSVKQLPSGDWVGVRVGLFPSDGRR